MTEAYPRAFGKYILVRPLAMGRMGEVHLALAGEIGGLEKLCVIKKLKADVGDGPAVQRFLEEAKVSVKLNHSNLVQVFDVGAVGGDHYVAMEYIEGQTLAEVLERCAETRTTLPPAAAVYLAVQICRGLQYAHTFGDLNLVHGDLCPANVLVSFYGDLKIAGFSMSYVIGGDASVPEALIRHPAYVAPEQLDGGAPADRRADVYGVGIILWELLVGEPLRSGLVGATVGAAAAAERIASIAVTPPSARRSTVPPQLDPLLIKALQPRPEHRPATAEALRTGLARALAQIDPTFESSQLAELMRRLYRRQIETARAERQRLLFADYQHVRGSPITGPGKPSAAAPEADDLTGAQRFGGRYRVLRMIGEGGMGAVYEAEHVELGRRVALKVLHAAYCRDAEAVARFREEARAATKIGHPNIIEVVDSGVSDDGRFYFVMELLSGTDLAEVMAQERTLAIDRSISIVLQICEALHAAHEAGIIHRDLKPENIYLTERGGRPDFVTLLDFGIAKNLALAKAGEARLTTPGIAIGTPEYMAPEQAAGQEIDRRIDVYATATMLYEMLTGHLPHPAQNLMQLLQKKAAEKPVPPSQHRPELAGPLEDLLLRALTADREQRTSTMRDLAAALEAYRQQRLALDETLPVAALDGVATNRAAADLTEPALPPPRGTKVTARAPSSARGPRLVLILALAALAVAAVGVAAWRWVATPAERPQDGGVALAPDARPAPDLRVADAAPDQQVAPPHMTTVEMERLLEWAKRAAEGRRYTRPRGDNVRELLERVSADYPGHPRVLAFREWLAGRLARRAAIAHRKNRERTVETTYRAWIELEPDAARPRVGLSRSLVRQGRRALARRRVKQARKLALEAQDLDRESAGPEALLGDVAVKQRRHGIAATHYKEALERKGLTRWQRRALSKKLAIARRRAR